MPSSRGARKAAKTKRKPASLISKRSSSGLPRPRRGGRAVSSPHRSSRQVGAQAPRSRGLSPRRRGRAHLNGSGRPSPRPAPAPRVARELGSSPASDALPDGRAAVFAQRFRAHAYVGILGYDDDRVIGPLNERSPQSRLSNVTVQHGKTLGLAVVLQNEVLAYFQPVPPIWPQGTRFCAGNSRCVKPA